MLAVRAKSRGFPLKVSLQIANGISFKRLEPNLTKVGVEGSNPFARSSRPTPNHSPVRRLTHEKPRKSGLSGDELEASIPERLAAQSSGEAFCLRSLALARFRPNPLSHCLETCLACLTRWKFRIVIGWAMELANFFAPRQGTCTLQATSGRPQSPNSGRVIRAVSAVRAVAVDNQFRVNARRAPARDLHSPGHLVSCAPAFRWTAR